jgi:ABC-type antimicrobial peptide transport system permease subunit
MASIGVAGGIVIGFVLARAISHSLVPIDHPGALAFVGSAILILSAALVASAIPAMRAARVNAVEALRSE